MEGQLLNMPENQVISYQELYFTKHTFFHEAVEWCFALIWRLVIDEFIEGIRRLL